MTNVFVTAQLGALLVFGFFISDFRRKPGMTPLFHPRLVVAMKLCYPVPILTYVYILTTLEHLTTYDFIALAVTSAGTLLVVSAKRHLATHHAWTGYYRRETATVTTGVYRWIRHPLYTGIAVVIAGSFFTIFPHGTISASAAVVVFCAGILLFLALSALRETRQLLRDRGDEFARYRESVHSFLPLRPFKAPVSNPAPTEVVET